MYGQNADTLCLGRRLNSGRGSLSISPVMQRFSLQSPHKHSTASLRRLGMKALDLAALKSSSFLLCGLHEGSYMLVMLLMNVDEGCCMSQKHGYLVSSWTLDITAKTFGCSIDRCANCVVRSAKK